jgi:N-acetylmuramoyl-L-alanine amidase
MRRFLFGGVMLLCSGAFAQEFDALEPNADQQPPGALSGASVFVSAGHGWMPGKNGAWVTQRGVSHGVIEDHSNGESVLQFLIPYLWNAGARVYSTRERDMNSNMVILDAGTSPDVTFTGAWSKERAEGTWDGFCYWTRSAAAEPTASARFTPDIPEDGFYAVYAWYRTSPLATRTDGKLLPTASDAVFQIQHSGGLTRWTQDLSNDDRTWTYLGRYYFEKGKNADLGSVLIENKTGAEGECLVVDAIRFGGGMGDTMVNGAVSGKPRWEESGLQYTAFAGFTGEGGTRPVGTVTAMPLWAEWECEEWEVGRAAYLSWHTNASGAGGKARGLSSFVYGPNSWGKHDEFLGHPLGLELCKALHGEVIRDVHVDWDPEWRDIGTVTRWLGETNPRNNNVMPTALLEYGFHDNAEDARYILDPRFRNLAARATMQGMVDFTVAHWDGFTTSTLLPEPPTHFAASTREGALTLSWQAGPADAGSGLLGDAADRFVVRESRNGKGFDNGGLTGKEAVRLTNADPGRIRYFYVAGRNDGGESFPSEVLATREGLPGEKRILLVNGFDRLDGDMNLTEADGARRGFIDRMNSRDYVIQHGEALAAAGYGFDSVSNEAVTAELINRYPAVVWILGQEKGETQAFSEEEQRMLRLWLATGRALFVSGSEWGSDLAATDAGKAFRAEILRVTDVALLPAAAASAGVPFAYETGNNGRVYPVVLAQGLTPGEGAEVVQRYGSGDAAVVRWAGPHRVVSMGIPFETILDPAARTEIMKDALAFLLPQ